MKLNLKAEKREISGKAVQSLREENKIPAVMYGPETKNINLSVNYLDFEKIYKKAGESTLVNLKIEGEEETQILIHDVSYNPVSDRIDHIDFYKIKYGQKLTARVELEFVGEPKAVKELGGILVTNLEEIEIECLPKDLISKIEVDLTALKTFDDTIHVKDLDIPKTIKILTNLDDMVASVSQQKMKEEVAPAETEKEEEKTEEGKEEKTEEKESE